VVFLELIGTSYLLKICLPSTVSVGQGQHFHAEYLFILRKLVTAEAKNRIILEDSYFYHTKKLFFEKRISLKFWYLFLELLSANPALLVRYIGR
jgi:hypothetical protein